MAAPHIELTALSAKLHGLTWQSEHVLKIGRHTNMDIVLSDVSVDREHAEIRHEGLRWIIRDVAQNPVYPTLVNHMPLTRKDHVLNIQDIIQIGRVQLKIVQLVAGEPRESLCLSGRHAVAGLPIKEVIQGTGLRMHVQAATHHAWEKALEVVTLNTAQRPADDRALLTLVRANKHLTHLTQLDELLQSILKDTTEALHAQRGSIILADPNTGTLTLHATLTPKLPETSNVLPFSRTLTRRCFHSGESFLCREVHADEALSRSIRHGAMASVICALLRTPGKAIGVLHLDRGFAEEPFSETDLHFADAIAANVAVGIETALALEQQRDQFIQTVTTLARAALARDQYASDHAGRLTNYSLLLADELKLPADEKYNIQVGTPLYDIGKIGIDDRILSKPGKLTTGEFEVMKTHTVRGASMLNSMFQLTPMIPIVRHHHERWDGQGYPDGLARDGIPLTARIVAVADSFAAMTTHRPYRSAMSADRAFLELIGKAGTHFDPACVYAFLRARSKVENLMKG